MTHSQRTFVIGGDVEVRRLGFGAMRITGPGTWGASPNPAAARALLRRAVELGVQLIDTADVTLPIPGTATRAHLEDNLAATALRLDQDEIQTITAAVSQP